MPWGCRPGRPVTVQARIHIAAARIRFHMTRPREEPQRRNPIEASLLPILNLNPSEPKPLPDRLQLEPRVLQLTHVRHQPARAVLTREHGSFVERGAAGTQLLRQHRHRGRPQRGESLLGTRLHA
jgi:hypothetical protein